MKNINTKILVSLSILFWITFFWNNLSYARDETCATMKNAPCVTHWEWSPTEESVTILPNKDITITFNDAHLVPVGDKCDWENYNNSANIRKQILNKISDNSAVSVDFQTTCICECFPWWQNDPWIVSFKIKNISKNSITLPKTYIDLKYPTSDQNNTTVKIIDWKWNNIWESLVWALNFAIELCNLLFAPLLMFAGWLLTPDWTVWDFIGLRPALHSLWVLMFNLVYVIFAFLLIYIAILNIFKEWKDSYAIKAALPRLVIALLIVPFSWFWIQSILSVSNILTAAILQIPKDTLESLSGTNWTNVNSFLDSKKIPKNIIYLGDWDTLKTFTNKASKQWTVTVAWKTYSWNFYRSNLYIYNDCSSWNSADCYSVRDVLNSWSSYNVLMAYAYWVFNIGKISQLVLQDNAEISDYVVFALWFVQKVWVWALFFIVFLLILLALVLALFKRAFYLWLYVIFSPFFALSYFFNGKLPFWWKDWKVSQLVSFKEFLSLALVPVYVSVALSLWFIFLWVAGSHMWNIDQNAVSNNFIACNDNNTNDLVCSTKLWSEINFAMKWDWKWAEISKVFDSFKEGWLNTIQSLILSLLGIVILWMAVMAALKSSKITEWAVKEIESAWNQVWKFVWELPKHTPMPIPGLWKTSIAWLDNAARTFTWTITWELDKSSTQFWQNLATAFWYGVSEELKKLQLDTQNPFVSVNKNQPVEVANKMMQIMNSAWWITDATISNTMFKKEYIDLLTKAWEANSSLKIDQTQLVNLSNATTAQAWNKIMKEISTKNESIKKFYLSNSSSNDFSSIVSWVSSSANPWSWDNNEKDNTDNEMVKSRDVQFDWKTYNIKTYSSTTKDAIDAERYVKKSELPEWLKNKTAEELWVKEVKN